MDIENCINKTKKEDAIWYAMYAYKRERHAKSELDKKSIKNFIPMRYEIRERNGKKERKLVPAVSNLVFVYATHPVMTEFKAQNPYLQYITQKVGSRRQIIIVPQLQMQEFIKIAEKYEENLSYYKPEEINLAKGTKVRVHGGAFDGVIGTLLKVKGKRSKRIVVSIPGVTAIAAAYIQPELIEIIP